MILNRTKSVLTHLSLLSALTLLLCICTGWEWSSAKYKNIAMTDAVDPETQRPVEVKDVFPPATPELFCTAQMSMVPEGTEIKVEWVYVGGEAPGLKNYVLETTEMVIDEGGNLAFRMPAPASGWMRGNYRVDLYVVGKKKGSVSFVIQGPDAVPSITDATMCHALDPYQMTPVNPTDVFSSADRELCCSVRLDFAPDPVEVVFAWYYLYDGAEGPEPQLITTIPVTADGGRHLGSSLPVNEGKEMPLGNYVVRVMLSGEPQAELPFRIVSQEEARTVTAMPQSSNAGNSTDGSSDINPADAVIGLIIIAVSMLFTILLIVIQGIIFAKAGLPWWGCLVPIYNIYLILKVASKPGWWLVLAFIPFVNFVFIFMLWFAQISIAKNFGKGVGFGLGLMFLPIIFYPVLAFGSARYQAGGTPVAVGIPPPPQG